jgi:hypothetical protein
MTPSCLPALALLLPAQLTLARSPPGLPSPSLGLAPEPAGQAGRAGPARRLCAIAQAHRISPDPGRCARLAGSRSCCRALP